MYEVGDVLYWRNNAFQADGNIKSRYFIYLGNTSLYTFQINIYTVTTTSLTGYYQAGGSRCRYLHIKIPAGSFGLPKDSIVDVDSNYMPFYQNSVMDAASDIEVVGKLDNETLRAIYRLIAESRKIPPNEKDDIYTCLRNSGIKDISKPKLSKKSRGRF